MQGRSFEGTGQEFGRDRTNAGAGKEQSRSRRVARWDLSTHRSHIPSFIQIVLKT